MHGITLACTISGGSEPSCVRLYSAGTTALSAGGASLTVGADIVTLDFTAEGLSYALRIEGLELEVLLDAGFLGTDETTMRADAVTVRGEMDLAYHGEITTPSQCGRMDQCCAFGARPVRMIFDGDRLDCEEFTLGATMHIVIVELAGSKDALEKAVAELHNLMVEGRALRVEVARADRDGGAKPY